MLTKVPQCKKKSMQFKTSCCLHVTADLPHTKKNWCIGGWCSNYSLLCNEASSFVLATPLNVNCGHVSYKLLTLNGTVTAVATLCYHAKIGQARKVLSSTSSTRKIQSSNQDVSCCVNHIISLETEKCPL